MKLPKCLREEIKAMLRTFGSAMVFTSDDVLVSSWDTCRDEVMKKYKYKDMPVCGKPSPGQLEGTALCNAGELHKMVDDIDTRIMEVILLDGGHRDRG